MGWNRGALEQLRQAVGADHVVADPHDLVIFERDASIAGDHVKRLHLVGQRPCAPISVRQLAPVGGGLDQRSRELGRPERVPRRPELHPERLGEA